MKFARDDNLLLTVSRDRHLSIFTINRTAAGELDYKLFISK
ncbi:hypothetical protein CCACVL1_25473, partial [Corchorus capsularis]